MFRRQKKATQLAVGHTKSFNLHVAMATTPAYDLVIHQFFPAYELQAYCHFAGLSYTIVNSSYPNYSCTGELPQVQHGQMLVSGAKAFAYLKMVSGTGCDAGMPAERSLTANTVMCA